MEYTQSHDQVLRYGLDHGQIRSLVDSFGIDFYVNDLEIVLMITLYKNGNIPDLHKRKWVDTEAAPESLTRLECIAGAKYGPVEEEYPSYWLFLSSSKVNIVYNLSFIKIYLIGEYTHLHKRQVGCTYTVNLP